MMLHSYVKKTIHWLLNILYVQCFVTILSLPILVSWGLPISLMTVVGNLLFSPVLAGFLCLSTLVFFSELMHLPNGIIVAMLEQFTGWWLQLIGYGSASWLVGFAQPSWMVFGIILGAAFVVSHLHYALATRVALLMAVLLATITYLFFIARPTHAAVEIPCGKNAVALIYHEGTTILIDPGAFTRLLPSSSWMTYQLPSELLKHTGSAHIDHLIVLKPSVRVFENIRALSTTVSVNTVHLPYWQGTLPPRGWAKFCNLCTALTKHGTSLQRFGDQPWSLDLHDIHLTVTPRPQHIGTPGIKYPVFRITGNIGDASIDITAQHRVVKGRHSIDNARARFL